MKSISQLTITLLAAGSLLTGCKPHGEKESVTATPRPAVQVKTAAIAKEARLATEEVVGTVRSKQNAVIAAKVSGSLQRILVAPGQLVKAGDWLAQIDAREIQARLDQANAARELARKDVERLTKLLTDKAITQQEFDAVDSRLRVAEATVKEVDSLLSYTRITAPFDGVITRKLADAGDLAVPGKPLFELEDPAVLRLEADVPEAVIGRLKLGLSLPVRIASVETNLAGVVCEIAPTADPNSRTFLMKVDLPTVAGLRSGQFGRVEVPTAEISALRMPFSALVVRGQLEIVFVAANQKAQMRLVKTGKHLGSAVEIVSGLEPGERIVVEGAAQLTDGQPLIIQ